MSMCHGIDLGNSTTIVTGLDEAGNPIVIPNHDGEHAILSNIYFNEDGTRVWGNEAWNFGLLDPSRYVADAKRFIGSGKPVCTIDGRKLEAWQIQQIVLEHVWRLIEQHQGTPPDQVVISVPANYTDAQKNEVLEASRNAGLKVLRLAHEPSAALIGLGVHRRGDGLRMVIDVGGSTTDVSVGEVSGNSTHIITTNGIAKLGGQDFDAILRDWALRGYERQFGLRPDGNDLVRFRHDLAQKLEQVKRTLSTKESARVVVRSDNGMFDATLSQSDYRRMTAPLVKQVMDCVGQTLDGANIKVSDLREVLFVGGQSQDPAFAEALESRHDRKPWPHTDPLFAVAKGNMILGRLELERQGHAVQVRGRRLPPLNLATRDVTAHPIGVAVLEEGGALVNSIILPKGTPIPSDRTQRFSFAEPGQTAARVEVLQGQDGVARDACQVLGHFDLTGAQAVHDREHPVEIRCCIDRNGMLKASAFDPIGGATAEMEIAYRTDKANGSAKRPVGAAQAGGGS
jgi:molecular chaperone DnaK